MLLFLFKKYVHILNFHNLTDAVLETSVPMCIYSATNMALGSINILENSSHLFFAFSVKLKCSQFESAFRVPNSLKLESQNRFFFKFIALIERFMEFFKLWSIFFKMHSVPNSIEKYVLVLIVKMLVAFLNTMFIYTIFQSSHACLHCLYVIKKWEWI